MRFSRKVHRVTSKACRVVKSQKIYRFKMQPYRKINQDKHSVERKFASSDDLCPIKSLWEKTIIALRCFYGIRTEDTLASLRWLKQLDHSNELALHVWLTKLNKSLKWADVVEKHIPLCCLDTERTHKVKLRNSDDIISHPEMWFLKCCAWCILFTTLFVYELDNLPGSGTTGQTRTDYHLSASLPEWTANEKQALITTSCPQTC